MTTYAHTGSGMLAMLRRSMFRFIGTQSWLRLGIRYRLLTLTKKEGIRFTVPFGRFHYSGTLDNYIDWHVFYYGAYELGELTLMRRFIYPESTVLDVGANVGNHSLFFAQYAKNVLAFEPFPQIVARLKQHITENKIENVHVLPFGLGATEAELPYSPPSEYNQGVGTFAGISGQQGHSTLLLVRRGDDALREQPVGQIDLIKIDVEGFELEVLAGLTRTLETHRPALFVEFSRQTQDRIRERGDLTRLAPTGYRFFSIVGHRPFLGLFNRQGCSLHEADHARIAGNILMLPEEKMPMIRDLVE